MSFDEEHQLWRNLRFQTPAIWIDLGDANHFFSIYFYIFFHLQNRWDSLGHAASCAEAAAKDLRNVPRGRVASLMESWEEDGIRFPALPGILCNWGSPKNTKH